MQVSEFYFDLPEELIAQKPLEKRDESRLLVLNKENGSIEHSYFKNITNYLKKGDLLVLNNSKVLPARIFGEKIETGAVVEFVLLTRREGDIWECLVKPGKKARPGDKFNFSGKITCEIIDIIEEGIRLVKFEHRTNFYEVLDEIGNMPLPPYIKEKLEDKDRYQTVYAKELGSAAAPTAGLHFTKELISKIEKQGIGISYITLHVGLGTFRPVKVDTVEKHKMHSEHFTIPPEAADAINKTKENGGRVIAVGTTSCRTLEAAADENGKVIAKSDNTDIFIYPGYKFKVIDALITNFHLPESTLIMLVSALAGKDKIMNAYNIAIKEKYRFFSFGDAMFIY